MKTAEEDSEQSAVDTSLTDVIKQRLHRVYLKLMADRKMHLPFTAVMLAAMTLQLIGYIYYRKTEFPFEDEYHRHIADFLDILRVLPALESVESTGLYLTVLFCMAAFLLLYVLQIVFIDYSIGIGKFYFTFPVELVRNMSSVLFWILTIPMTETMVSVFDCKDSYHRVMTGTKCWNGIYLFYAVLSIICLLLFLAIALLIAFFYNETRLDCTDCLSRLDTNLEFYLFLYRFMLAILSVYGTGRLFRWILAFVHVLGSGFFVRHYFTYVPYYHRYTSIIYGSCMCSYLWASANLMITMFFESSEYTGQSIVIVLGIIVLIPLVKSLREKRINNLLFENKFDKIKNDFELDLYVKKIIDLMNSQGSNFLDEIVLLGFVNNHPSECKRPECPLNAGLPLYLPATDSYAVLDKDHLNDPVMLRHLLMAIYILYTKNYNTTAALHISYSHFLLAFVGNIHKAMAELSAAEKQDKTLQQGFTIYRSKRFIEDFLMSRYKSKEADSSQQMLENLDATLVISFESLFGELRKSIEKSTREHIEFWNHLDSILPDTNVLHQIGLNIIGDTKETQDIWAKLIKINGNYPKALFSYGSYLSCIKNDEEEGTEYLDKAKALMASDTVEKRTSDFEIMFAEDTAVIVISGSRETQGNIVKTNEGVKKLFKYTKQEVINRSIGMLMPSVISAKHQSFLESFFKSGKERILNRETELFAIPRNGLLISISMIVKPVPRFKTDIRYIGMIREQSKEYDYILMNEQGKIDSVSAEISQTFGLSSNFLKKNEVYIQLLCPELLDLVTTSEGKVTTKFDICQGVYYLNFILPKDFMTLIQNFTAHANTAAGDETQMNDGSSHASSEAEEDFAAGDNSGSRGRKKTRKLTTIIKKMQRLIYGRTYESEAEQSVARLKRNFSDCKTKWTWRVEIANKVYNDGVLRLKVFRISKAKNQDDFLESPKGFLSPRILQVSKNEPRDELASPEQFTINPTPFKEQKDEFPLTIQLDTTLEPNKEIRLEIGEEPKKDDAIKVVEDFEVQKDNSPATKTQISDSKNQTVQEDEKKDALEVPGADAGNNQANSSVVSDANASRVEERPLIALADATLAGLNIEGSKSADTKKTEAPSKASSNKKEMYLKKGSAIAELDEQEQIIRNYITFKEPNKENASQESKPKEKKNNVDDEVGSVISGSKSFLKHLKALRKSAYEDYSPSSILQLRYTMYFVFASIFIITLVYFFLARRLYNNLSLSIENVYNSNARVHSVLELVVSVRSLVLMNEENLNPPMAVIDIENARNAKDYYKDKYEGLGIASMDYKEWTFRNLNASAISLKHAQNGLSTVRISFGSKYSERVNPSSIEMVYHPDTSIATEFRLDCWSAVMGLVTHSLKIHSLPLTSIRESDISVYYVLHNSLNSVLAGVYESTYTILDESDSIAHGDRMVILVLMIVGSAAILISAVLIVRVMVVVIKNKESILVLFTEIPEKHVKVELTKCRHYINAFKAGDRAEIEKVLNETIEIERPVEEHKTEEKKEEDAEELLGEEREPEAKKRQYKSFATHILALILQFLFFVLLLEGYFLLAYFRSSHFLARTIDSIKELGNITERYTLNSILYTALEEYMATNGEATIMGLPSEMFLQEVIKFAIDNQEEFLKVNSKNKGFHASEYNNLYNGLIYDDFCVVLYEGDADKLADCNEFYVLNRGLQAANVAFWDTIRDIANAFMQASEGRDTSVIKDFFSDATHISTERLKNRYLDRGYEELQDALIAELDRKFDSENRLTLVLFVCYLVLVAALFFVVRSIFVESTRLSLWVTKSMLSIIPLNTIQEVRSIKDFLMQTSQALFTGI